MSQIIMRNREKQNLLSQFNTINSAALILVISLRQQWTEWRTYEMFVEVSCLSLQSMQ